MQLKLLAMTSSLDSFQSFSYQLINFFFIPLPDTEYFNNLNMLSNQPVNNAVFLFYKIQFVKTCQVNAKFVAKRFAYEGIF